MARNVHLVGSVGLDTAQEVFLTAGRLLRNHLKRVPDGEPGGRRMWINWQYPLLRGSPFLQLDRSRPAGITGCQQLQLAEGVQPADIRFGELGYTREARTSYQDFLEARGKGVLAPGARFQVCLPTPFAVIGTMLNPAQIAAVEPAYEAAMIREAEALCAAIPHRDLCVQWDVCIEMIALDGRTPFIPPFPGMEKFFGERFARLAAAVPADVEMGYHLCYGDLDAKHTIEPLDSAKLVQMAGLIASHVKRPIAYVHMPVPRERDDDAYFAPLADLKLPAGTELYLGLVHPEGTDRRMATARRFVKDFGIASECGISRARTKEKTEELLEAHAAAAKES